MATESVSKIILIADDCELNRDILQLYFEGGPYEVLLAEDGKQAVDIAISRPLDLILMDMQMPVMNGFDAIKAICSHEKNSQKEPVVIISISGLEAADEKEEIFKAGCTDLIVKPIRKNILLEKINQHLGENPAVIRKAKVVTK